jgi:hypothetical protein
VVKCDNFRPSELCEQPSLQRSASANKKKGMEMKRLPQLLLALFGVLSLVTTASVNAATPSELVPIKNQNFGGLELIRACNILPADQIDFGFDLAAICNTLPKVPPQEPLVNLRTRDMLYFNYEIPAANVAALEGVLQSSYGFTDKGFRLAPIALLKDSEPKYYMSLNFYSVVIAGVVNYRSEWSTYVRRAGDPKPRFMVLQVQSSEDTADPMSPGFINPATYVEYTLGGGSIVAATSDFRADLQLAIPGTTAPKQASYAWAEANDYLYYANGVADTALYNGMLTDAALVAINPGTASINNASLWAPFIAAQPSHIVYFSAPLEFAFTPYFNLNDPTLKLDPAYVGALQQFRTFTFGAFSYGHAFLVLQGLEEPILRFDVLADNVPSVFINFNIPRDKVKALEAYLDLPDGIKLAQSKMTPRQPARYLLTLNVYESPDALTGQPALRAEWSVYVKDRNDPSAKGPYLMVVDVDSNSPSLDPYNLFTPPTGFAYANVAGRLEGTIRYQDNTEKFSFAFGMPPAGAPSVRLHEPWILANDRIYWRNGVYDMLFYNGLLLDADVVEVDPKSVVIDDRTVWSRFIDPIPTQVAVFRKPLQFVLHPWYNVEELAAKAAAPAATGKPVTSPPASPAISKSSTKP